ncbi:MAG TPA: trypsin-like peptidase domain-containing protein [Vicinamibacterales bacterium]|nr:trypsin-like peptidase domain-containing protein [Vicinamibacterales bacterium]
MPPRAFAAVAAAAVLLGGSSRAAAQTPPPRSATADLRSLSASIEALTNAVAASVVQVVVTAYGPLDSGDDPGVFIGRQRVVGSGAILSADGYIITNAHVVEGAQRVRVVLHQAAGDDPLGQFLAGGATRTVDARLVGTAREYDLALLKVDAAGLRAIPLADYHKIRQGELVFAFGSPEGLPNTVTMGVVSAVARQPDPDSPTLYLQTDAPINPGNSGGPLVNVDGELVGVNTFILSQSGGSQGLGFAIPSAVIASAYPDLRAYGRIRRGVVGIDVQAISGDLAAGLHLPQTTGVVVSDVLPDTPAADAGVRIGDIVAAVGGRPTPTIALFGLEMSSRKPGDTLTMDLVRDGARLSTTITVIENPVADPRAAARADPGTHTVERLGIIGVDVDQDIVAMMPKLRERSGVLVAARDASSQGTDNPLTSGDIIHRVNAYAVRSIDGLRAILDGFVPGARIVVQIEHDARLRFVVVHVGR